MKFNLIVEVDEKKLMALYQKIGIPVKNIEECMINEVGVNGKEFDMKVTAIHAVVEDLQ